MEIFVLDLFVCFEGIAIRESAKVIDQAQRKVLRGVDDLDFFIGDEAIDKPTYATKVRPARDTAGMSSQECDRRVVVHPETCLCFEGLCVPMGKRGFRHVLSSGCSEPGDAAWTRVLGSP